MKAKQMALSLLVLAVALPGSGSVFAEPTWVSYGGSEYALTETGGTWTESEAEAVTHEAHLVAINDSPENQWLVDTFGNIPYWIGLHRPGGYETEYIWVNGDSVGFTSWAPGQPDWPTWPHNWVSINLFSGDVGLWHNSANDGYPSGVPGAGIMERMTATSVHSWSTERASWSGVKVLFQ